MKISVKKIGVAFLLLILLASTVASIARAEVEIDNRTQITLTNSQDSCFQDSKVGLWSMDFLEKNSSYCWQNFGAGQMPSYCTFRYLFDNPTLEQFPVTVRLLPTPDNLQCPAPAVGDLIYPVSWNPYAGESTDLTFNMSTCWGWWCDDQQFVTETQCPFGWDSLQYLGFLGGCHQVNVTVQDPTDRCPTATFTMHSDDIRGSLVAYPINWANGPNISFTVRFMPYTTKYDSSTNLIVDNKTLSASAESYITGMETILGVNMSLLNIIYLIFEIIAIITAVIGLPTLVIMLIRYVWESVTGRPFSFRQGARRRG